MRQLRIGASFAAGWEGVKEHFWLLLTLLLAGWVLSAIGGSGVAALVLSLALGLVLSVIHLMVALRIARGETVTFSSLSELSLNPGKVLQYTLTALVGGLIVLAGLICLVIPGIYAILRFQFAPLAALDRELGLGASLKESTRLTQGVKLDFLLFLFGAFGLLLLGLVALILGVIPALLTVQLAWVWLYVDLQKQADGSGATA